MEVEAFIIGLPAASGAASLSNQEFIDCFQKMEPGTQFGLTLYSLDGTTPDLVDNPWVYRCLLIDRNANQIKIYNIASGNWEAVSLGSVTSASQITDGIITVAKLSNSGGGNFKILRLNGSNAPEWAALATILGADTVPLAAINRSTAAEGGVLRYVGGQTIWDTLANLASAVIGIITSYDIQKLSGKINSAILTVNGSGVAEWQTFATFLGTTIPAGSIDVAKIKADSATDGQYIKRVSGTPAWADPFPFTKYQRVVSGSALPAAGANATIAVTHTLGILPKLAIAKLVCTSAESIYAVGDELNLECLGDVNPACAIHCVTGTPPVTVNVAFSSSAANFYRIASGSSVVTITPAKWSLVLYLYA